MTYQTDKPLAQRNLSAHRMSAREFLNFRDEGLDLNPPYQRGSVWTEEQRIKLVRSWLAGVPIPAVTINNRFQANRAHYLSDSAQFTYAVIDGKQRIETTMAWFDGELNVPASWFEPDHIDSTVDTEDGPYVNYRGLTREGRLVLNLRALIPVIEVAVPTIQEEAELYLLLEQSGTHQTEADLENARRVMDKKP